MRRVIRFVVGGGFMNKDGFVITTNRRIFARAHSAVSRTLVRESFMSSFLLPFPLPHAVHPFSAAAILLDSCTADLHPHHTPSTFAIGSRDPSVLRSLKWNSSCVSCSAASIRKCQIDAANVGKSLDDAKHLTREDYKLKRRTQGGPVCRLALLTLVAVQLNVQPCKVDACAQ